MNIKVKIAIAKLKHVVNHFAPECAIVVDLDEATCYNDRTKTFTIGYDFGSNIIHEYYRAIREDWGFDLYEHNFNFDFVAIMHEIGHYFTFNNADAFEGEEDIEKRVVLSLIDLDTVYHSAPHLINEYYKLPKEAAATEWMLDWIFTHPIMAHWFNWLMKND